MELTGTLSNPAQPFVDSLDRVATVAHELRGTDAVARTGQTVGPRCVLTQAVVEEIVKAAGRPIRVNEICAALEERGVTPFEKASIRKTLHDGSRAKHPRYRRTGWGLYQYARVHEKDHPSW